MRIHEHAAEGPFGVWTAQSDKRKSFQPPSVLRPGLFARKLKELFAIFGYVRNQRKWWFLRTVSLDLVPPPQPRLAA